MNPARLLVLAVLAALVAIVPASLHAEAASPQQAAVETLIGTSASRDDHPPAPGRQRRNAAAAGLICHRGARRERLAQLPPARAGHRPVDAGRLDGTWDVVVSFSAGTYTFVCDPHNDFMNGSFSVGSGPPPPPPPPPPSGERVLTGFVGPGYDIGLRDAQGNDVNGREIPAGDYRIEIYDYSPIHNFELKGDDFDEETEEDGRDTSPGARRSARARSRVRVRPPPQLHVRLVPGRAVSSTSSAASSTSATAAAPTSAAAPPPPPATATARLRPPEGRCTRPFAPTRRSTSAMPTAPR